VLPDMPVLPPYRGKPALPNDGEGRGNDGIIRTQVAPRLYPTAGGGKHSASLPRPQCSSEVRFLGFRDVRVLVVVVFVRIFGTDPFGYVVGPRHIS
jgi:hypothetical protein